MIRSGAALLPRREDRLHEVLGDIRRNGVIGTQACGLAEADRGGIRFQVRDARRADGEMLLEAVPLLRRQLLVEVSHEEVDQLAAFDHRPAPPKRASRRVLRAWRARCSRVFTTFGLTPSIRAVSSVSRSSMSRRSRTVL